MIIVITGVAGVGKTTVGALLAQKLSWQFIDADDFHPESNISKMRQGIPLTDEDREEWLKNISAELSKKEKEVINVVLACSALKESYRKKIISVSKNILWVFLEGSFELISKRLINRTNHFMPPGLLQSQFDILEVPTNALIIDSSLSPDQIISVIEKKCNI